MRLYSKNWNIFKSISLQLFLGLIIIVFCSEYAIYYAVLFPCHWPFLEYNASTGNPVYAMIIADTHLLGSRNGHWLDKLRREWQMHRAFQTAMTLYHPELVFILGDLYDEGLWCNDEEFNNYVDRFHRLFRVPPDTEMFVVVGNHDIGFHYRITPYLAKRFEQKMNAPPVAMISRKGNHFILINSMAMEGDGCFLCNRADKKLDEISGILECANHTGLCKNNLKVTSYSRPIILQHFPLYRESDELCTEPDAAPIAERNKRFKPRWDCLSREASARLLRLVRPRLAFGGHTHHACEVLHDPHPHHTFLEYSVPSFSWRNRPDPKLMLLTVNPNEYKLAKCALPTEAAIITLYAALTVVLIIGLLVSCRRQKAHHTKPAALKM